MTLLNLFITGYYCPNCKKIYYCINSDPERKEFQITDKSGKSMLHLKDMTPLIHNSCTRCCAKAGVTNTLRRKDLPYAGAEVICESEDIWRVCL